MTRTLILGAAVSGKAAAALARRLGQEVTVYDRDPAALGGVDAHSSASGEWNSALLSGQDLVVSSPGFPEWAPPVQAAVAADVELVSEMEFAYRELTAAVVAVTGTNGKTTTTTAAADMLIASGVDAVAAGNIGLALSDVVGSGHEVVVVEASSFQLRFISRFHPRAAAVLNVSPDHLDWHGSAEAYLAAKRRIGERQLPDDIIVFDADDPGATAAVAGLPATPIAVSGQRRPAGGNGPHGEVLHIGDMEIPRPALDAAFMMDMVAAGTLAQHMGASATGIEKIVTGFTPVTHRRTLVGTWGGVSWVNDSKATNPHAAIAAAGAYPSVVLIAGGRNKGLDLAPLAAVDSVRALIAIGEAQPELAAATAPDRLHLADSMKEAVAIADAIAVAGDTVLLAPGCASFDLFDDYQHRGRAFTDLVRSRKDP